MKTLCLAAFLASALLLTAQEESFSWEDFAASAQTWAEENLDETALRSLQGTNQEIVRTFFADAQKRFEGEYVIDLAQLRDVAMLILPWLESSEETLPYALWLKSRLDYLEVANELSLRIPPPKIEPGTTSPPPSNPKPTVEREIWIKKMADRPWPAGAKPYVKKLKTIFTEHKVPAELVWIAEVESSFDPRALSPAGAAGLFQLMPATAKQYGLKTWPRDQRYQPVASAQAAAQHLAYLHRRFKDWRLAIAAYNAGEGTVQRALKRTKLQSFDAIAPRLPAETQMYVPKVEATLLRREGIALTSLAAPPAR